MHQRVNVLAEERDAPRDDFLPAVGALVGRVVIGEQRQGGDQAAEEEDGGLEVLWLLAPAEPAVVGEIDDEIRAFLRGAVVWLAKHPRHQARVEIVKTDGHDEAARRARAAVAAGGWREREHGWRVGRA